MSIEQSLMADPNCQAGRGKDDTGRRKRVVQARHALFIKGKGLVHVQGSLMEVDLVCSVTVSC
jgi:hypothetical protein